MVYTDKADCVVIGAGVIGLAIAREMANAGRDVIVLEQESLFGSHTSARNSEVIHAGIYYAPGSLKARACVTGKHMLYDYCAERSLSHKRIGKLIVARSEDQFATLEAYKTQAKANGVTDLRDLSRAEVREMEPEIDVAGGVFSPSTGIIDSHELMMSYLGDLEAKGGTLALNAPVLGGAVKDDCIEISVGGDLEALLSCRLVINSAGLFAPRIARKFAGLDPEILPGDHFAIGHYFTLTGRSPFHHLIYPVTEAGGLGVHVTLDLGGQVKFGPDVSWRDDIDYTFDETRRGHFVERIRQYYPDITQDRLVPGYTGIRPKLHGPDDSAASGPDDFRIDLHRTKTGALINLFGIESPGLTASMALAKEVMKMI